MTKRKGAASVAALAASTLAFGLMTAASTAAHADPAPGSSDIVGVGSDTLQYMLDFGADGDVNGHNGYNFGKTSRIANFDATPDANARAGYLNGSTSSALLALNPTIFLRAGSSPRQRPNGSGAGLLALELDSANQINFARSSSPLGQGDVTNATGTGGSGALHEVRLANDTLSIAAGNTTHAVPLSKAQLKQIYLCASGYTHWSDSGVGGTSTDTIIPVIPQNGSGTRKTFLTAIGFTTDGNGNVTQAVGGCVKTYEENDPYALFLDSSGNQVADPYVAGLKPNADAIEPISGGRLTLYQNGYFYNPNQALGKGPTAGDDSVLSPDVALLPTTGTASDGGDVYTQTRGLYVDFRDSDVNSTTHFNGSTKNWVNTLFLAGASGGTPFFNSPAGKTLLQSAGVTPAYDDCGVDQLGASACP
ncbi:substrate-binding domain-containing protein [uncultured Jatrophihabitans sp.]|uniref:substrate-binding domain-containing protein n=1 Tax=uncultured Jatrophihabitans sp. TaxID=1610747 RepID=UPI0035C9AB32